MFLGGEGKEWYWPRRYQCQKRNPLPYPPFPGLQAQHGTSQTRGFSLDFTGTDPSISIDQNIRALYRVRDQLTSNLAHPIPVLDTAYLDHVAPMLVRIEL